MPSTRGERSNSLIVSQGEPGGRKKGVSHTKNGARCVHLGTLLRQERRGGEYGKRRKKGGGNEEELQPMCPKECTVARIPTN